MTELAPLDPQVDVTVCIVNWNGAQLIRDCLRSLREVQSVRMEIIVVDNASEDNSLEVIRTEFPEVQLITNPDNKGFAAANNQAIRRGRGRYFFILNNDTVVSRECLSLLLRFLSENPRAGIATGRLANPDGSTQFQYYPVKLPTITSLLTQLLWLDKLRSPNLRRLTNSSCASEPEQPLPMEQVPGACMFVRRAVFETVGFFDEGYRFWYEDVDLCARCRQAGWELWYLPNATVAHRGAASANKVLYSERSLLRFRGMLRYARKFFDRGHFFLFRLIMASVLVLRLPLVLLLSIRPHSEHRRLWKGTWRAYCRLLAETFQDSRAPARGIPDMENR